MSNLNIQSANPGLVHVEFYSENRDLCPVHPNEAGEFVIPAKDYRIYRILEEKPEAIYQFGPDGLASFLLRSRTCENCAAVYLSPLSDRRCPVAVLPGCECSFPRRCYEGVCRG